MGQLEKHYGDLLGLAAPWKVAAVKLEMEKQRVEITVEWSGAREADCPKCGKSVRSRICFAVQFNALLDERNYRFFEKEFRIVDGEKHGGVFAEGMNRGLRFVFGNR